VTRSACGLDSSRREGIESGRASCNLESTKAHVIPNSSKISSRQTHPAPDSLPATRATDSHRQRLWRECHDRLESSVRITPPASSKGARRTSILTLECLRARGRGGRAPQRTTLQWRACQANRRRRQEKERARLDRRRPSGEVSGYQHRADSSSSCRTWRRAGRINRRRPGSTGGRRDRVRRRRLGVCLPGCACPSAGPARQAGDPSSVGRPTNLYTQLVGSVKLVGM
jgi:hypothetical protein